MPLISHKFMRHVIDPSTEILIIGTFNPGTPEGPDFFYGRSRNYLWQLLPHCYGLPSLKQADLEAKKDFMRNFHIDFADLISLVNVPGGQEDNVDDIYIDDKAESWKEITEIIDGLSHLSTVFFTRKTFGRIPNIKREIKRVRDHVRDRGIYFACLETPARYSNDSKQRFWVSKIIHHEPCESL